MTIQAVAREDVFTVAPDTTVVDIADLMAREQVGSTVVVDGDHPIGIVTDRDLALDVIGVGADPAEKTARDVMHADLFTVEADTGVFEAINEMCEAGVRRVPIVDGDVLVGIVTMDDLLVLLAGELTNLASIIQSESPPYAAREA